MIRFTFIERMLSGKVVVIIALVIIFLAEFSPGLVISRNWKHSVRHQKHAIRESGGHTYTNPLLDFELGQELLADQELRLAHDRIEVLINKLKREQSISVIINNNDIRNKDGQDYFGIQAARHTSGASCRVPYYSCGESWHQGL